MGVEKVCAAAEVVGNRLMAIFRGGGREDCGARGGSLGVGFGGGVLQSLVEIVEEGRVLLHGGDVCSGIMSQICLMTFGNFSSGAARTGAIAFEVWAVGVFWKGGRSEEVKVFPLWALIEIRVVVCVGSVPVKLVILSG